MRRGRLGRSGGILFDGEGAEVEAEDEDEDEAVVDMAGIINYWIL